MTKKKIVLATSIMILWEAFDTSSSFDEPKAAAVLVVVVMLFDIASTHGS